MILLVFHDLTPVHRAEIMRADFIANASHELRTPLASLSGFIDTLLGSARDDAEARAPLPRHHEDAGEPDGAADRRPALALARRAHRAHASRDAGRSSADRSAGGGRPADAGAGPQRRDQDRASRCARDGCRRSRRAHARVREPRRERTEIWRERQARRHRLYRNGIAGRRRRSRLSRYATTVRASRPSTFRGSPSASIASMLRKAAPKAAPVSASRWSSTSSIATAASSRSRARPARARPSRCGCR